MSFKCQIKTCWTSHEHSLQLKAKKADTDNGRFKHIYMVSDSQTVDDGASLSTLHLPVMNLSQKAKEGFLGVGHVAVRGPAQELEMTQHKLAFLEL